MSMTFTKLFTSITESTIWAEPDHTRLVWITMLAMADHAGRVWGSIPGLANRARVPLDKCEEALRSLMSPDKYSRTKDNEGRRIEEIDGGWHLLNHAKYRAIRDEESIKESKRRYINARRAKERSTVEPCRTESNDVDRGRHNAEAEAEAEAEKTGIPPNPRKRGRGSAVALRTWLSDIKASGAKPVPEGDPVFAYAERVGIPSEFLALAWFGFKHRYLTQHPDKRYADWRRVFRNAVESNWLKFWWVDGSGAYALTTAGQQAKKDFEARQHEAR